MSTLNFDNHFKDLFENTSDLIHFLTIEGDIIMVNPAWLKTLGYRLNEVKGRSIYDFLHPAYAETYKLVRQKVISENSSEILDTAFLTKNGSTVVGEGQLGCAYQDGKPVYTRLVFRNTTGRRLAEKKVEENEKRLKTFFKNAPDAVIVINQNQQILEWNPKATEIFGFDAFEVIGQPLSETIIPHQYREAHKKGMERFLKTGEGTVLNKTIEITALHKNGREFFVELSISNVMIDGEWLFIAFLSDISERKATEENLIRKEAELLHSKMLDDKKDEFISIASHELKTPLTTIKAYTQLALSAANTSEKVQEFLSTIDQQINKLSFLLNELLDVSRIQAGKLKMTTEEIEFSSFLQSTLNSIQQITPHHKIILENNHSVKVMADPMRLEQVIANLISNAAKYSPGKDKIFVNSVTEDHRITISVSDSGIGISQQNLEKIFTRFYRIDESLKNFSGLGIGLYISSEIIKQHSGKIWAESSPNVGSTFYFELPVEK